MDVIPINEAEAVIDPFWDPEQSDLKKWAVEPGEAHGLKVRQNWCWASFEWVRRPAAGPALRMSRTLDVNCSDYDRLVLSVMAPEKSVVRMVAETDRGTCRLEAAPAGTKKKELELDLQGAALLKAVTLEVEAGGEGISQGWFNWLGFQHTGRLAHKLATRPAVGSGWEKHLKPESFEPEFKPAYGLVLNADELATLREKHAALTANGTASPFVDAAEAARAVQPEDLIHDYVNFWDDTRYNRERAHGKFILNHGLNAAIAGHLLKDKNLLRLAARYALSIGMVKTWDDGFICRLPGSTFEHRCFVQSLCASEVAGILDLAGECFTAVGRDFLLRRLAEEAVGAIQFNTWKHDYIFHCNQLSWFTPGRMLALGVLNRHYPRVRPYIEIAYQELCESLDYTILPDGGYVEGPTYFRCVGRDAGLGIYFYSRILGKPMDQLIPPAMKRCGDFAEALASTDDEKDMVPICDGMAVHEFLSQAIMAGLLPNSAWAAMMAKAKTRNGGWPVNPSITRVIMADAAIAWKLSDLQAPAKHEPRPFVALPDMGPMASHRRLGGEWVKWFIQGNQSGAGHTHEDKGSFILEFAGDTFAMDPGTCDYSHPLSGELHNVERHNMLVPYGFSVRPGPQCPLKHDVKPSGAGAAVAFHADVDATPGWEPYYRRWHRTWDSPAPDRMTITDDYELVSGEGVEFYWQTRLPVSIRKNRAIITGKRGRVEIEAPEGCDWRVEDLPLLDGVQHRLAFRRAGEAGLLNVSVHLIEA